MKEYRVFTDLMTDHCKDVDSLAANLQSQSNVNLKCKRQIKRKFFGM